MRAVGTLKGSWVPSRVAEHPQGWQGTLEGGGRPFLTNILFYQPSLYPDLPFSPGLPFLLAFLLSQRSFYPDHPFLPIYLFPNLPFLSAFLFSRPSFYLLRAAGALDGRGWALRAGPLRVAGSPYGWQGALEGRGIPPFSSDLPFFLTIIFS